MTRFDLFIVILLIFLYAHDFLFLGNYIAMSYVLSALLYLATKKKGGK